VVHDSGGSLLFLAVKEGFFGGSKTIFFSLWFHEKDEKF
jgi:hypothetical protein